MKYFNKVHIHSKIFYIKYKSFIQEIFKKLN